MCVCVGTSFSHELFATVYYGVSINLLEFIITRLNFSFNLRKGCFWRIDNLISLTMK